MKGIGGDEAEVHGEGVVGGDEMEGKEGDSEEGDEAVDAGTLVGGEDFPPFDGGVGEDHGDVEGDDGGEDMVKIRNRDHCVVFSVFWVNPFGEEEGGGVFMAAV